MSRCPHARLHRGAEEPAPVTRAPSLRVPAIARRVRAGGLAAVLAAAALPGAAAAQSQSNTAAGSIPNPPDIDLLDDRNVQIDSGYLSFSVADVAIGGSAGLSHATSNDAVAVVSTTANGRYSGFYPGIPPVSSFVGGIQDPGPTSHNIGTTFAFQGVSERFSGMVTWGETPGASMSGDGGTLTKNADGSFTYVDKHGVRYDMSSTLQAPNGDTRFPVTRVLYPDGSELKIHYRLADTRARIQGVQKSNGFFLKFVYPNSTSREYSAVIAGNLAYEYCDVAADSCALALAWPQSQAYFSNNNTRFHIVDSQGRETRFTLNSFYEVVAMKPAESDVDTVSYEMCARSYPGNCSIMNAYGSPYPLNVQYIYYPGMVFAATRSGVRVPYGYQPAAGGYYNVLYSQDPYRGSSEVLSTYSMYTPANSGALQRVTLPSRVAHYNSQNTNRLNSLVVPGSSREEFTWDSRRNMTSRSLHPKDGVTAAPLTTTIDYEPTCSNIVICNKPRFTLDPKLNRTDFDYDPVHGGIKSVTGPAVNGVRPQTRYEYVQRSAWLKNSSGGYTASPAVWVVARESSCRNSAATGNPASPCATAGDEVSTAYDYGPDSGPNNLLVRGVAVTADGKTLRTCYGYDRFGNRISETSPRAGLGQCS